MTSELPAIYHFAGHIKAEEAPMKYHYNDFVDFVNGQDPNLPINHEGWCGCAIGDFVQENCDTREDAVVHHVLDMLFPEQDGTAVGGWNVVRVNDDIYEILNECAPATYGELAQIIEANERS